MAAGRAGEPLAPAHVKERLSAGLLGAEALPELDLAQALDRAPQSFCRCHHWSPPAPTAAETLAPPGMRVMGNQVLLSLLPSYGEVRGGYVLVSQAVLP